MNSTGEVDGRSLGSILYKRFDDLMDVFSNRGLTKTAIYGYTEAERNRFSKRRIK